MFGFRAGWDVHDVLHLQPLRGIIPLEVEEMVYLGGIFIFFFSPDNV